MGIVVGLLGGTFHKSKGVFQTINYALSTHDFLPYVQSSRTRSHILFFCACEISILALLAAAAQVLAIGAMLARLQALDDAALAAPVARALVQQAIKVPPEVRQLRHLGIHIGDVPLDEVVDPLA